MLMALPPPTIPTTAPTAEVRVIRPQPGPQEAFLATPADIAVYGGKSGAGKTYALELEPLRHTGNGRFNAVIFRRTSPQIRQAKGLWDTSLEIYPACGATPRESMLDWKFPGGAKIAFAHMEGEHDYRDWDGAQIPLICFDQLESFTERQFWYMFSRNRTTCGIVPYIRATCNPDPDHFLRQFLSWWIDDASGYAIESRSGVIRWFVRQGDVTIWADTRQELIEMLGPKVEPLSFTFIPGGLEDNPELTRKDPQYRSKLEALPYVDRERLLGGNWNIRYTAGTYFKREWFEVVPAASGMVDCIRYWDRAATDAKTAAKRPGASWTAGVKMGKTADNVFYVLDVDRFQETPLGVESRIKNVASQDGDHVRVGIEQDPGQAGKVEAQGQVRSLAGYQAKVNTVRESKGLRAKPLSAQCEAGNVKLVRGPWNDLFLRELANFDGTEHCMADQVDAASGAFHMLTSQSRSAGTWRTP